MTGGELINLLCIIHRDGGHYIQQHGLEKAYVDAVNILNRWKTLPDELETERMKVVACGVVAMANTRETAEEARKMRPEYRSASLGDVERAVDCEMQYREELAEAYEAGKRDATPEWQPIETAPRGVLEILLRSPNGKISNGYWGQECNRGKGAWVWPYVKSEPSHWMPLPAAPKGEA